jgi:hypothetical protein
MNSYEKCRAKQSDFQTDSSVRDRKPREGLLTYLKVTILLVITVCSVVEIELSGSCVQEYGHNFISLYVGASKLCFVFCVIGILLICSAYFMRRTSIGKLLQHLARIGLWGPITTQCVVIPVIWLSVLFMWPGGDDGGGFGWFIFVGIPTAVMFCIVGVSTIILLVITSELKQSSSSG